MWSPDDKGNDKVNDLYMKIISMPGRVKSMKDLSDTLKTLIALERQAFGLDDENNKPVDALTALLERGSLPYRQLRKVASATQPIGLGSLPYRQLRNC